MFQLTLVERAIPGLSLLYFSWLTGVIKVLGSLWPLNHCIPPPTAWQKKKKRKRKRLSGTIKIPVDCRSCDLAGALTYCSFLSPYLGFVGIKLNQEKQKTKSVLVCLLIFGFVFTFARAKERKWSKRYFQTYMVNWFRITDSKSVCKNKTWLPLPALRRTVSERPHLALVIRKLNKILETTVFRSWTAGHLGLSS